MTPGGFHAFDHRWSLNKAFEFQMEMGRDKVHQRTTALSTLLKNGLREIQGLDLITPSEESLSAGINCFMLKGYSADGLVKKLHESGIVASSSPYRESYARLTPCVINTEEEVEVCVKSLQKIALG